MSTVMMQPYYIEGVWSCDVRTHTHPHLPSTHAHNQTITEIPGQGNIFLYHKGSLRN